MRSDATTTRVLVPIESPSLPFDLCQGVLDIIIKGCCDYIIVLKLLYSLSCRLELLVIAKEVLVEGAFLDGRFQEALILEDGCHWPVDPSHGVTRGVYVGELLRKQDARMLVVNYLVL